MAANAEAIDAQKKRVGEYKITPALLLAGLPGMEVLPRPRTRASFMHAAACNPTWPAAFQPANPYLTTPATATPRKSSNKPSKKLRAIHY
jgi:hypothetical protein